jgi:hypothetical protein
MVHPLLIPFIIIAVLAVIALLIFSVPIDLSVTVKRSGGISDLILISGWSIWGLKLSYSDGRGAIDLLISGKTVYRKAIVPASPNIPEILEGTVNKRALISMIQGISDLWPGIVGMLKALIRHTRVRLLACDLVLGTGNPADTGLIFGIFSAVRPILMISDRVSLSLQPVFDRKVLEGTCRLDLRLEYPLIMFALALRLVLSSGALEKMKRIRLRDGGTGA